MAYTPPHLTQSDLSHIAPFHLHWDNEGNVLHISEGLHRFWHHPSEEDVGRIELIRPFATTEIFPILPELTDMLLVTCHGCCACKEHTLRCEVRDLGDQGWLLVGLPDVSRVADLEHLGFSLSDLPVHVGLGDLLIANEAAQVSLEESRAVEKMLTETNRSITAHNRVFERFVPSRFLDSLAVSSILDLELGQHVEMHGTVMFADMHGFTSISEAVGAKAIFEIINQYLSVIVPCIEDSGGVVVHYQGDGVIALFPGHDGAAITASIAMQYALKGLNASGNVNSPIPLRMSVGLPDGPIVLGVVGDADRWDASLIADAVNTSSRIEALTRVLGGEILVSRSCLDGASDETGFHTRSLGEHTIRGRKGLIELIEILDALDDEGLRLRAETESHFKSGLKARSDGDLYGAISAFSSVLSTFPSDKASQFFLAEASRKLMDH